MMEYEGFYIQPELKWSLRRRIYKGEPPRLATRNVYEWWMGMRNATMQAPPSGLHQRTSCSNDKYSEPSNT